MSSNRSHRTLKASRLLPVLLAAVVCSCRSAPKSVIADAKTEAKPAVVEKKAHAVVETPAGTIVFKLLPEAAPKTVETFTRLAEGKKYSGTEFSKLIRDFLVQSSSPKGPAGWEDEFSAAHGFEKPGAVGMADGQFFITALPAPWLNSKHTVFGEVVEGLDAVEKLSHFPASAPPDYRPLKPAAIIDVRIEPR